VQNEVVPSGFEDIPIRTNFEDISSSEIVLQGCPQNIPSKYVPKPSGTA
jgi:hypothetical protein